MLALSLALLFPLFWVMGSFANPAAGRGGASARRSWSRARHCETDPFAELFSADQTDAASCSATLTAAGVPYTLTSQRDAWR